MAAGDPGTIHLGSLRGSLRRATAGRLNQFYATTDPIAERVRKLGAPTLRSIGQISRWQRVKDNDADYVTPIDMLAELREGNQRLVSRMREAHVVCDEHGDVATASLIEVWIDEAERRVWFLLGSLGYRPSRPSMRCTSQRSTGRTSVVRKPVTVAASQGQVERRKIASRSAATDES